MAPGSIENPRRRRQGPKDWLVPVAVLVIALLTAVLVERLYASALQSRNAQTLLVQIEEEVNEQQLGEYEAIVEGEVTPEISGNIAESRADTQRSLNALEAQAGGEQPARIRELLVTGEAAIDEELRLIEDGRIEEARAVDEEVVDPTFEELRDVLENADTEFGNYAGRVDMVADVGGFAVAGLSVLLTAWFVRRDRNRRAEQEAIEESEERFRALVQEGADLIWILDADGTVRYVAPSAERVLGHTAEDIVGRSVFEFLVPENEGMGQGISQVLREPGAQITTELETRRADGSRALFETTFSNMLENPSVGGTVLNGHDVTERREAEEVLRDSEERYRALYEDNPSMYFTLDAEGTILSVNRFGARQLGHEPVDLVGRSVLTIFREGDKEAAAKHLADCLRNPGQISQWEIRKVRKDGSVMWVRENARAVRNPEGETVVLVNCEDVTERKQAEAEIRRLNEELEGRVRERTVQLHASEARLRALFAAMTDVILVIDAEGRYLEIAPTNPSLLYKPPEETIGRTFHEIFPEEKADVFMERIQTALETRQTVTIEYSLDIAGQEVWFYGTVSPMQEDSVLFVARDITERRRAEEAVRRSEERHRALVDTAPDAIITMTADGLIRSFNRGAERIFGYEAREAVRRPLRILMPERYRSLHEDGFRRYLETGETRMLGRGTIELAGLRKNGEEFPLELSLSSMGEGDDALFTGIVRDVTDRKRAEEELKSYARKLAQSNGELQSFAYVASHDLQEPLRKVRTFGDRLRTKYAGVLDERAHDYLDRMEGATARMQGLIEDLLTLSRITTKGRPFAPVDLGEVAREAFSDLEASVERVGGRVEVGKLPTVEADRMQMRQLLQNLIGNALKFHREGEPPVVKVHGEIVEEQDGGHAGKAVCRIVVEDEGIGFDKEHAERIFAPFERLHGRGSYEGTGMGLAICRRVVERHGGEIKAESAAGRGASFVVALPMEHHGVGESIAQGDGANDYAAVGR